MAWVTKRKRKQGTAYLIEFSLNGRKKSLFLPREYGENDARQIAGIVSRVCAAIETGGQLDKQTFAWLSNAPRNLIERFERAGLVEPSERFTLRELFDAYERAEEPRIKSTTLDVARYAWQTFADAVGENTQVDEFKRRQAREFASDLSRNKQYAEATKAVILGKIKRVWNWAVDVEIVEKNPFHGVNVGTGKNKEREFFVDRESFAKLLDVAPSLEWRAALTLYRIGGLRRGEAFLIEWRDVNWADGRLLVHSPKTARHKGKAERVIPLFPELREELTRLWESLPVGAPARVIATLTANDVSNYIRRLIFAAGMTPWARAIQNLRSSRSIEIYREFGAIAESEWIGHGVDVARDHYLHLLDGDFQRAAFPDQKIIEEVGKSVDKIIKTGVK